MNITPFCQIGWFVIIIIIIGHNFRDNLLCTALTFLVDLGMLFRLICSVLTFIPYFEGLRYRTCTFLF